MEHALSAFQHALQTSDYLVACYCVRPCRHANRLAMGHPLDDVYQERSTAMDFMRKTGFVGVRGYHPHRPALHAEPARATRPRSAR